MTNKLIRNSVFETNSSSCHSISISSDDCVYDGITPSCDNKIVLKPMDFGWDITEYHDALSKLTYCWIYAQDWTGKESEKFHKILSDMVCEHTGADEIVMQMDYNNKWYPKGYYGCIDHQSVECKDLHHMFYEPQKLKDFIFNPNSILQTDNDNH